jgi:hypothetical protein
MHKLVLMMFAVAGGLTLSGIVANLYRILAHKPQGRRALAVYYAVMVLAGPSVLFGNATKSFRAQDCSGAAYAFAVVLAGYWAFMLGLGIVGFGLTL